MIKEGCVYKNLRGDKDFKYLKAPRDSQSTWYVMDMIPVTKDGELIDGYEKGVPMRIEYIGELVK